MKNFELSSLAIKAINEVKANIKKLLKGDVKLYKSVPEGVLNPETVKKAAKIKGQIDILESQIASLQVEYAPLRNEILEALPGDKKDKVEVVVDGIQIKKHAQIKGAGKINEEKLMELARKKKILSKVTKKVRVIDEDALMLAIADGLITYDEYKECLSEGTVVEVLKIEQKFCPEVEQQLVQTEQVI